MFNFFKRKNEIYTGALDDIRISEEKEKDYQAEEVVSWAPVEWKEKPESEWRKFPIFNQSNSSSCVAQSIAKCLGINNYREENEFVFLSARDIYSQRVNKPEHGMVGADACNIAVKYGATLDSLMPSQNLSESLMNNDLDRTHSKKVIANIYRAKNWIYLPYDIDKMAYIISQGYAVMIFLRWDMDEWNRTAPQLKVNSQRNFHHAMVYVDYFLHQGKKCLLAEDSWGIDTAIEGRRIVSQEWFEPQSERITWCNFFTDLENFALLNNKIERPKLYLSTTLRIGDRNKDVGKLQIGLGLEKDDEGFLFPISSIIPTRFYGGITRAAVKRFQKKYGLEINGIVDEETRKQFNKIFS